MSYFRMMEERLPPGFRFHPRDEELVCDYLEKKITGNNIGCSSHGSPAMIDVDLNNCEPWDLPEMACVGGKEWYFFSLRGRKYATGQRTNRATLSGYWKATGKDRMVSRKGLLVGMRKTLVFYQGRAPTGRKTDWVMHEFRRAVATHPPKFSCKEDWALCRVFFKSRSITPKQTPTAPSTTADSFLDAADGSSSSLPSLTETYINFDPDPDYHSQISLEGYEQVPCFSSPPAGPAAAADLCPQPPLLLPAGTEPWLMSSLFDNDVKMITAVLNHLSKLEGSHHGKLLEP